MRGTKTAWVLGSGFSRSLGGPLLYELIGEKAQQVTREVFPNLGKREVVYHLFKKHQKTLWEHAELFLEFIDLAMIPNSPHRRIVEGLANTAAFEVLGANAPTFTTEQLRYDAVMTVAAECSTYTHNADLRAEAWAPYFEFKDMLGVEDTVITFNYDLVLESLAPGGNLQHTSFMRPDKPKAPQLATVLKLHGSVNWAIASDKSLRTVDRLEDFQANEWLPLIATPGATKAGYCGSHLKPLWDEALKALSEAQTIVFVGYRFPPSDAEARTRLLRAIGANKNPYLKIHLVLGPEVNTSPVLRLKGLLTHTMRAAGRVDSAELARMTPSGKLPAMYGIVTQPLYAEDFLTVVHPDELFDQQVSNLLKGNHETYGASAKS
jgi:hypothetical protein